MSSLRTFNSRKRRSDDECSSSDSDTDAPPVKKPRLRNRESSTLPKYLLYVKDVFVNKFTRLLTWMKGVPLGSNSDRGSMLKTALDGCVPLGMEEDDDDEDDFIDLDTDDDDDDNPIIEEVLTVSDDSARNRNLRSSSADVKPLSSSTPVFKSLNGLRGRQLKSLSRHPVNGCSTGKIYQTRSKTESAVHPKSRYNPNSRPITNPCLDVEVLLDTRETPDEESDDLAIVSEISNRRSSRRLARPTVSSVTSNFGQTPKEYNGTSTSSLVNGNAASCGKQRSPNKSFTAHEVIRLTEKEHYKLILEKMMGGTPYHPVTPKNNPKPAEIEIDLTEDEPLVPSHFRKENLEKPVNEFLKKYYKPSRYMPSKPLKDISELDIFLADDDDVQIIETKKSEDDDLYSYKLRSERGPDFFSDRWIKELKKTISVETEKRLRSVQQQEDKLERFRKRRDARFMKARIFRGHRISSDQSKKDEFPELTPEMDTRADEATTLALPPQQTLSRFKNNECTRSDMVTLAGLNWLNDSVINFYLALIKERSNDHPEYPSVYAFNSYFYSSLKTRGPSAVMRWTRRIEDSKNIFQFDILLVPLHLGMHWALCVIDNRVKKIKYYDSMQGTDDQCLRILQNYLVVEKKEKLNIDMDPNEYSLEMVKDIPQQMNGSDCGMFTLKYAEYISRDSPITFSQEHMQYFRRRMAIEILDMKLF